MDFSAAAGSLLSAFCDAIPGMMAAAMTLSPKMDKAWTSNHGRKWTGHGRTTMDKQPWTSVHGQSMDNNGQLIEKSISLINRPLPYPLRPWLLVHALSIAACPLLFVHALSIFVHCCLSMPCPLLFPPAGGDVNSPGCSASGTRGNL